MPSYSRLKMVFEQGLARLDFSGVRGQVEQQIEFVPGQGECSGPSRWTAREVALMLSFPNCNSLRSGPNTPATAA